MVAITESAPATSATPAVSFSLGAYDHSNFPTLESDVAGPQHLRGVTEAQASDSSFDKDDANEKVVSTWKSPSLRVSPEQAISTRTYDSSSDNASDSTSGTFSLQIDVHHEGIGNESPIPHLPHTRTSINIPNPRPSPLRSIYKPSPSTRQTSSPQKPLTSRRVRGLWNDLSPSQSNTFEVFRNETLLHIFSYLPLSDLSRAAKVNKRWRFLANDDSLWNNIDATDFIAEVYSTHAALDVATASTKTSEALSAVLKGRSPQKLTIKDIGRRLTPDIFLPNIDLSLQELLLDGYQELTDTHLHVMLLMPAAQMAPRSQLPLQKLTLSNCPRLGNAAVCSIAARCPHLKQLFLRGNPLMTDLAPVKSLISSDQVSPAPNPTTCSLQSLFLPGAASPTSDIHTARQHNRSSQPKSPQLLSLFAPPSPPPTKSDKNPPERPKPAQLLSLFSPPAQPHHSVHKKDTVFMVGKALDVVRRASVK